MATDRGAESTVIEALMVDVTRLSPQDGDLVVIAGDFDEEDARHFQDAWRTIFGDDGRRVMFMFTDESIDLARFSAEGLARIGLMRIPEATPEKR